MMTTNPEVHPGITLDPAIWPRSAQRGPRGLRVGGVEVVSAAVEHGTPLFLLDEHEFRQRCRQWREGMGDNDVYYAGKAFLSIGVVRWVDEEGLSLDVATGGELAIALRAGFPPARLLLHGNNKSVDELERAVAAGVGRVVIDSLEEIARLADVATGAGIRQRVLVRVTPGVHAHTHEYIATGQEDQKFGFSLATGAALKAISRVLETPSLELVGLHSHIGSQIFDMGGFLLAAHRMVELLATVRSDFGATLGELNLGGGLGIAYEPGDGAMEITAFGPQLRAAVATECEAAGIPVPRLGVEPGRSIIGPAGITIYEVGTVKELPGLRTYVSVDGGMSDHIRTALYDANYTAVLASRDSHASPRTVTICGKHCETGDIVARSVPLPADLAPGDLIAVAATGAYHASMASNYNLVGRPPVVAVHDGRTRVLVRREREDDLFQRDVG